MIETEGPRESVGRVLLKFVLLAFLFVGGAMAGVGLAEILVPGNAIAGFLSFFMFPLSFVAAMMLWQGFLILVLLIRLPALLARRKELAKEKISDEEAEERAWAELRRRAWVMIPAPIAVCGAIGMLASLGAPNYLVALAGYVAAGLGYGLLLWALAQRDLLFFGWESE